MNRKNLNFDNKNIKKYNFYGKNKKIFNIDYIDINKILISKKETYGKYDLLGMIMMLLHHYIYFFHKRLATLINLIKIK